jgi:hypothetical protein
MGFAGWRVNAYPAYGCAGFGIMGFAGWRINAYPAYGIEGFAGSRRPDKAKPPSGNCADAESKKPNLAVGFF